MFLFAIILIGIIGAVSFLKMNNNVESDNGLNAYDFDVEEIN